MKRHIPRLTALLVLLPWMALRAAPVQTEHVELELAAGTTSVRPGETFTVALRLAMKDHWHIYWRNPGDAGLPTDIAWTLPEGFEAGPIQWPPPQRLLVKGVANYGYEGEILLLVEIAVPAALPASGEDVTLRAAVSWLACKESCIPGDAEVELVLPVRTTAPQPDPDWAGRIQAARERLPAPPGPFSVTAEKTAEAYLLRIEGFAEEDPPRPSSVMYFPYEEGLIDYAADQALTGDGAVLVLSVPRSSTAVEDPERISGVLVADRGWFGEGSTTALEIDLAVTAAAAPSAAPGMGFFKALLYGILGGMILNLMPCVFPVISLKIMGFMQAAQGSRRKAVEHALVFAAGILVSFWVLAVLIMVIKAGGQEVGWAFQFQEPSFVIFMAVLFTLITLNMFGVFEIGTGLAAVGGAAAGKAGWTGSFFSGVLATLVATPCTGPFMAPVLGWALSQPGWVIFIMLTALGGGMALPYVLLSSSPALMKRIPRPGAWMESFKHFLGFVLLAFAGVMVWVLGKQTDLQAVVMLLAGLYLVGMGCWVLGRWGALHRSARSRWIARVVALALIVGGTAYAMSYRPPLGINALDDERIESLKASGAPLRYGDFSPEAAERLIAEGLPVHWQPWSPERLRTLREAGRPVFVDFTAAWCMICQANKRAMHAGSVEQAFAEAGVTPLEADWTKRDAVIRKELERYNRKGVPLYLLYPEGAGEAIVLPQNLTARILLDALEEAGLR